MHFFVILRYNFIKLIVLNLFLFPNCGRDGVQAVNRVPESRLCWRSKTFISGVTSIYPLLTVALSEIITAWVYSLMLIDHQSFFLFRILATTS